MYFKIKLLLLLFCSVCIPSTLSQKNTSFTIDYDNNQFLLDGKPFRYISGSIHYFRIHPSLWKDRLYRVRALGFNAIQFYIPWNFHEVEEGKYNFEESRDFVRFIKLANDLGLYTLLRIGPYVCGEWENGGIPWWLMNKADNMKMRTADKDFTTAVSKWLRVLLPKVKPLLRNNGGPVLMVQIENEYGSFYACDNKYKEWLRDVTRDILGEVVLYTTDPEWSMKCGYTPGTYPTIDFGPDTSQNIDKYFKMQMQYAVKGPKVNSEFYPGWFTRWGTKKQTLPSTASIIESIKYMYDIGASFNFYMIHGGTNFGFWNGAEPDGPVITSYDYFAPISEAGDINDKYLAIRDLMNSLPNWNYKPYPIPKDNKKASYGKIKVKRVKGFSMSPARSKTCHNSIKPLNFEQLDQPFGFVAYSTNIASCGILSLPRMKDFAYVLVNRKFQGTLVNWLDGESRDKIKLNNCSANGGTLWIFVENQGRRTFETINDHKGIIGDVYLDDEIISNWTSCRINIPYGIDRSDAMFNNDVLSINDGEPLSEFYGTFEVDEPADTFIDPSGWGKGVMFINEHANIGRYWVTKGPQVTLYVPAPLLKKGTNSIRFIEFERWPKACWEDVNECYVNSIDHHIWSWDNRTLTDSIDKRMLMRNSQLRR